MLHRTVDRPGARRLALEPASYGQHRTEPERMARSYPFEVSGGSSRRAMIAIGHLLPSDL